MEFEPTRTAALERLSAFLPGAGRAYAAERNYDREGHPDVSRLSPYIRHRALTEEEVLRAVLGRHSLKSAEKFVQEVFWRTYWKGWLELRPAIWSAYRTELRAALNRVASEAGLREEWESACKGETGIAAFDHWARELSETGYLHNHARMWFASIWIFTLRLPWQLGADFFMRHLFDADAASNTLSWRWVAGVQTIGKNYIARPGNIERYTEGRFAPHGQLTLDPAPLFGPPHPERRAMPHGAIPSGDKPVLLLVTDDDLSPGYAPEGCDVRRSVVLNTTAWRSPLTVSARSAEFTLRLVADARNRLGEKLGAVEAVTTDEAGLARLETILNENPDLEPVIAYPPIGPGRDAVTPILSRFPVATPIRHYDLACWPHATAGFFKFKDKIPSILRTLDIAQSNSPILQPSAGLAY